MKNPKITSIMLACIISIYGCAAPEESSESGVFLGTEVPLDDLAGEMLEEAQSRLAVGNEKYTTLDSVTQMTDSATFPSDDHTPKLREELEDMRTSVKIYKGNTNAGIEVPGFAGVKLGKDESNLSLYFIETKIVDDNGEKSVYGCGYSVHYLFKKVRKGLNITNLPSIAASAQLENTKTEVLYSIQSYGVTGNSLAQYFRPKVNQVFDVEGFGEIQSSLDGIHNVFSDPELSNTVQFTPRLLTFVTPAELGY